ncbi:hypothetical protein DUZ99_03500 [Xylanibacillus composti]|uniref:Uncharacterized protein n=1 Tax=Xylanibacillus composti TaxID=1572762 RepID=A0A8J4H694_9BACL|nr:hypothetical protein [Xylanibacillus composti]MDT9724066.1 hypothetical protein [Xylanibacillus composti]GIQ69458.1 hypothetical protein XYCOK13_22820 [Xylanibacillus composti]
MRLADIYIEEVTRRLPEKNREDIALELRSTIEDMLPDDYTEQDVEEALEKLGDPVLLAGAYRDKPMHLIGPRLYDQYVSVLKMIFPIAVVIALITLVANRTLEHQDTDVAMVQIVLFVVGEGIWRICSITVQVFFWVTLVFAILERTGWGTGMEMAGFKEKPWTPQDLKSIPQAPKDAVITRFEVFWELLGLAILATFYFYADHLAGVHQSGENGLVLQIRAFNQEVLHAYWPLVVLVIGFSLILVLVKLFKRHWTKPLAFFNLAKELAAAVVFLLIISQPDLLEQAFIAFMADMFEITPDQFVGRTMWGAVSIYLIFAVWNCIDGFRKAYAR